jgi:hypothetical protein
VVAIGDRMASRNVSIIRRVSGVARSDAWSDKPDITMTTGLDGASLATEGTCIGTEPKNGENGQITIDELLSNRASRSKRNPFWKRKSLNAKLTCDDAWFDDPAPHSPWHTHDRWSGRVHGGCQWPSSNTESIDAAPCQGRHAGTRCKKDQYRDRRKPEDTLAHRTPLWQGYHFRR